MSVFLAFGGIFCTAFIIGLSGAMMPGPLLAFTIAESARHGPWTGPRLMVGHMLLEAVLVTAVALGLGPFLSSKGVQTSVSLLGGAMMGWMGVCMLRAAHTLTLDVSVGSQRGWNPVVAGAVVSMANPYWTIWWATIGLSYILLGMKFGIGGIVAFFCGHILSDFAWYSFVSVSASRGRKLLPDRAYRAVIRACALILLLFGVYFAATGLGRFSAG